jgi:phage baseplate assembly protein W
MASDSDFGEDLGGIDDLDLDLDRVTGIELMVTDLACRLDCPPGGLIDDPQYGAWLRAYLSHEESPATRAEVESRVLSQIRLDERVERVSRVSATLSGDRGARKLAVDIDGVSAFGPFSLTVTVDQASTQVLEGPVR